MLLNSPIRLLVALALTATLVVSQDPIVPIPRCPENQQWYREKPCSQICGIKAYCSGIREAGCACKPGYLRQTPDSPCIPKDKCIICEELKVYDRCRGHCPPTCQPKMCSYMCVEGCICREGYAWHNERCIPRWRCPIVQQQDK
eukprot:XP_017951027.1 PREDICTED: zonadhesin-like [Xenopus tropicalis]